MKQKFLGLVTLLSFTSLPLHSNEDLHFKLTPPESEEKALTVNFQDVSMLEFLRFVSEVAEENFIYDEKILDFNISLVTGKATSPEKILEIMVELLNQQGIKTEEKGGYYLVEKMEEWELNEKKSRKLAKYKGGPGRKEEIRTVSNMTSSQLLPFHEYQKKGEFFVYKLQYHVGSEILSAIKNVSATLKHSPNAPKDLVQAIDSMHWVQSTNSILYSGTENGIDELTELIQTLDVPKKQVFIEVLVIETDVRKGLEFGLEWAAGGQYQNKFGYGMGNFPKGPRQAPFAQTMQGINATNTPTGTDQFPLGRGFDLGVIGDIILHKGRSYFSLGSLVSALQADGDSTIVLNQKIITQDNKLSRIFVGDNLAFTGSTVETIGASQQTSANIEYRDVGVKLNITPLLGDGDVITLEISEEITNVIPDGNTSNGINTTKTDMATQVHVPDQSFLVLSGMIRNTKRNRKSGIPCLGGLPLIGAAFSKST
ncbi:MAG: type II secretion system protein GspD, partial [Simkania sp.]|nr:type II secretion system protein GspD [Simkania sp.]